MIQDLVEAVRCLCRCIGAVGDGAGASRPDDHPAGLAGAGGAAAAAGEPEARRPAFCECGGHLQERPIQAPAVLQVVSPSAGLVAICLHRRKARAWIYSLSERRSRDRDH